MSREGSFAWNDPRLTAEGRLCSTTGLVFDLPLG